MATQLGSLKQRIRNGEIVIGVAASLDAERSHLEKILESHSYDFFHVDSQHLPLNEERLARFCRIAGELERPVILRIKHPRQAYLVGALADLGPLGVEVPQVETADTAREALEFFYYPPVGKRSVGGAVVHSPFYRPGSFESRRRDYANWWNENGILMLQVESLEAVVSSRLLALPGVDCLSWGAAPESADLAFSLEGHPNHPLKTDEDCLQHVLRQIEGTGVRMLVRVEGLAQRQQYMAKGITVFREIPPRVADGR